MKFINSLKTNNVIPLLLFISSSVITFSLGNLYYISTSGPDFDRYKVYIEYFYGFHDVTNLEQGVFYFFVISLITKLRDEDRFLFFYDEFLSNTIQIGNFIFYVFGLLGMFYLLKKYKFKSNAIFLTFTCLNFFPPMLATRLIFKPEILCFSLLPWVLFLIKKYEEQKDYKYLLISIPLLSIIVNSKATVSLMIFIYLILNYTHLLKINKRELIVIFILGTIFTAGIFIESQSHNSLYTFQHQSPEGYKNNAEMSFAYNIDPVKIYTNPFSNNHKDSFIGITLLDTFGDYFNIYWNNDESGFKQNRHVLNNSKDRAHIGILLTIVFYFFLFVSAFTQKRYRKYTTSVFIGSLTMLFISLFIQFDPTSGDMVKTYYYSFFLSLSFIFVTINYLSKMNFSKYLFVLIYIVTVSYLLGFPKEVNDLRNDLISTQNETSVLCELNNSLFDVDSDCTDSVNKLCDVAYSKESRIELVNGELEVFLNADTIEIFSLDDNQIINVSSMEECLKYFDDIKNNQFPLPLPYLNIFYILLPFTYIFLKKSSKY